MMTHEIRLLDRLWRTAKAGCQVRCVDDTNGAHFLRVDQVYTVDQMQRDAAGNWWVCLIGMARAWPVQQFERII